MDFSHIIKNHCIAITGGICTGKTTVSAFIHHLGYEVIDADILAREAVKPNRPWLKEIIEQFGNEVLTVDGTLNRKKMGEIIFTQPPKKLLLESILHPAIHQLLEEKISMLDPVKRELFFYEATLVYEKNSQDRFKEVWVTCCDESIQVHRLKRRSGISTKEAQKIIMNQLPQERKKSLANFCVDTGGDHAVLEASIKQRLGLA